MMKKMIRFIAFITTFAITMSFFCICFPASAGTSRLLPVAIENADSSLLNLWDSLTNELTSCTEEVNIKSQKVSSDLVPTIVDMLCTYSPEMFHVEGVGASTIDSEGIINAIVPKYDCTQSEYKSQLKEVEAVAEELLDGIKDNAALSDVDKALLIHDRLATHCSYYPDVESGNVPHRAYTMYAALITKVAVCQGYALAYQYLLSKVGIQSCLCLSKDLGHAWNIVKINGKLYHVDVTWDDPLKDITGRVNHSNFLLSSAKIRTVAGHDADDFDTRPTDTTYDDYFWTASKTEFQLINGALYFIDNTDADLKCWNCGSSVSTIKTVVEFDGTWKFSDNVFWPGNYSKLSSFGNVLLYSLPDGVYAYDPSTNQTALFFDNVIGREKGLDIYGMKYRKSALYFDLDNTPNNETDNLIQLSEKIETAKPSAELYSVDDEISESLSMKIQLKDDTYLSGFWFSTSPTLSSSVFRTLDKVTETATLTTTIKKAGTYYLTGRDVFNNVSETVSFTVLGIKLDYCCEDYDDKTVLVQNNTEVTLPVPSRYGYAFLGWTTSSGASEGEIKMSFSASTTLYAIWQRLPEVSPTSIRVASNPSKTEYYFADKFDSSGLVLELTYPGGTVVRTQTFTTSSPDMTQEGEQSVTVTSEGLSTSFKINIKKVSLTLSDRSLKLTRGATKLLTAESDPDIEKTWESSDTNVATVDSNGNITAVGVGTCKVSVYIVLNAYRYRTVCNVTVVDDFASYKIISYPRTTYFAKTNVFSLSGLCVRLYNSDGSYTDIDDISEFEYEAPDLTYVGKKTVTVSVYGYKFEFEINVIECGIVFTQSEITLRQFENAQISGKIMPESAAGSVKWKSSNAAVASVDAYGLVTANKKGTAVVTASFVYENETYSAKCDITVSSNATGIKITSLPTKTAYKVGETLDMTGFAMQYEYDDGTFADIDATPNVKLPPFESAKTYIITFEYSGFKVSFDVGVFESNAGITLDKTTAELRQKETLLLSASCLPSNSTVTWKSSNTDVATVKSGLVTALKAGTSKITASIVYQNVTYTASCTVTVTAEITGVKVSVMPSKTVYLVGETLDMTGCKLQYVFSDNSVMDIETVPGLNIQAFPDAGIYTIKFKYDGYDVSFKVTVKAEGGSSSGVKGDTNGDGEIKLADAMMAFKYVAKTSSLSSAEFERADCNSDGDVKLADAMAIFKYVAKVSDTVVF